MSKDNKELKMESGKLKVESLFSVFNLGCVRDWSGILLERSGKRYSGKPDGDSRTPKKRLKLFSDIDFLIINILYL